MRATIVADDNIVVMDGKARNVDTSQLVIDGIHAVQWYGELGEEEYRTEFDYERRISTRRPNRVIDDISAYQPYFDAWEVENEKQMLIEQEQRNKLAEQQAALEKLERERPEIEKRNAEALAAQRKQVTEFMKLNPEQQRQWIVEQQRLAIIQQHNAGE